MPLQNFIASSLPTIKATWLNAIDAFYVTLFQESTTPAAARAALGIVEPDASNAWTKNQYVTPVALTSTSNSIAVDASLSNNFEITLTENTTLAAPTNLAAGMHLFFHFVQDSTPRTLAFAGIYKFDGGTDGVMPTASGAVAILSCYCPTGATRLESVFNGANGLS